MRVEDDEAEGLRKWSYGPSSVGSEIRRCTTFDGEAMVVASGRTHCRECGEKITRGDAAIPFAASFTASRAYIHRRECCKDKKQGRAATRGAQGKEKKR